MYPAFCIPGRAWSCSSITTPLEARYLLEDVEPAYTERHSESAIVLCATETMAGDFDQAIRKRPKSTIVGINRAGQFYPVDMLVSQDHGQAAAWKALSINPNVTYHGVRGRDRVEAIDYYWPAQGGSGTSGWFAAKILIAMGFEEIILCGMKLEPGPYADGVPAPSFDNRRNTRVMRERLLLDTWAHPYVTAMSGWPKEVLG